MYVVSYKHMVIQVVKFVKAGKIQKAREALRIEIDGVDGDLVIGAKAVRELLGNYPRTVEISRVRERGPDGVVITYAGTARMSTTGRGLVMYIAGNRYTTPLTQVRQVVAGGRSAALVSKLVDEAIIDADEAQAQGGRRIDEGLAKTFA